MAGDVLSAGIMIVGAVVAATFLVTAILPAIFSAGDTFGTVAHSANDQIRTDFEIIRAFTPSSGGMQIPVDIWIKNTGQTRFNHAEIESMDVFFGNNNGVIRLVHTDGPLNTESFSFSIESSNGSDYWSPGNTLHIKTVRAPFLTGPYYFALATPNGVQKAHTFGNGL